MILKRVVIKKKKIILGLDFSVYFDNYNFFYGNY